MRTSSRSSPNWHGLVYQYNCKSPPRGGAGEGLHFRNLIDLWIVLTVSETWQAFHIKNERSRLNEDGAASYQV
ncbi:hypothetical protein DUNSADRAFT_17480 [Dunaliella salina]|uniref:Encoded protein n=1 Tax=Dunaliella salina TaxID=3046 RepID=A0ABQ7G1P6_DUNSA|nr:hypothetical protein DUNSADRAFT_17480 [Dunaliella salina]|eukprot:KAF5828522.1 hypothetical protein DUNSADRAFT_17480 [Dunaliella salina]